jgi:hypothetical protein
MTREEIRQENEEVFKEYMLLKIRGEKGIYNKLATKYNVSTPTIWRKVREAQQRLSK